MAEWRPERLSVVVPTYNRPAMLERVLRGLEAQTWPRARFEVIVIDDGGDEPAAPVVEAAAGRGLPVVSERQTNAGPAAARNRGSRRAQGDLLLYLDDDCEPEPRWLAEHALAHTRRGLAAMGRIDWHPEVTLTPLLRYVSERFVFQSNLVGLEEDAPFPLFYTANASVDRQWALEVGLFDESFPRAAWEDTEFAYRLRLAGTRFIYRPTAIVYHLRGFDLATFLRRQRVAGYEAVRAWTKHPELRQITGVDEIVGEAVEFSFFEAAGQYAWLIGAAEALGPTGPGSATLTALAEQVGVEPDLARWRDDYVREHDRLARAERAQQRQIIEDLQRRAARYELEAEKARARLEAKEQELAELRQVYDAQTRWANEMERRLAAQGGRGTLRRLAGRLLGWGRGT